MSAPARGAAVIRHATGGVEHSVPLCLALIRYGAIRRERHVERYRIRYIPVSQGSCDEGNSAATMETFPFTGGRQCFIGGFGPGPFAISNNYIGETGLLIHFDNSGHMR